MKSGTFAARIVTVIGSLALTGAPGESFAQAADKGASKAHPPRKDTVLYQLKEDATGEQLEALSEVLKTFDIRTEKTLANGKVHRAKAFRNPNAVSEKDLALQIQASGAAEFAEVDALIPPSLLPSDPYLGSQWQLTKINAASAWNTTTGNTSVSVAVCDSGVESTHPDLKANLILPGFNTVDNTTNSEPVGGNSHGTFVSGVIGAAGNNGVGVSGVVWNIKIHPVRISNDTTSAWAYYSDMSDCITWSANQGAKVVNLSYAGASSYTIDSAAQYLRSKGGLLFMAAGNDGTDNSADPDFTSFVIVGATDSNDNRASWSNYGTPIDIVGPGVGVYSTRTGAGYGSGSGTSFSSPVLAGVAALLYSVNPSFTPAQIENFLFTTAVDIGTAGEDSVYGHGRVDAAAALNMAINYTKNLAPTAVLSTNPTSGMVPLTVAFDGTGSSDPDGTIKSYSWNFGDGASAAGATVSHTYGSAGSFVAQLTVTDSMGATATAKTTIVVDPDPSLTVSVARIDMSLATSRTMSQAISKVFVLDRNLKPVSGATVSGLWSGVVTGSVSGVTGADGSVTLSSPKSKKSGTFALTIQNISAGGLTYDASKNGETSDSITK